MATTLIPLVNGKSYEFADIEVIILGVPIVGITAIQYGEDANIENVYGTGRFPVSRGHGQVTPTCKITFLKEEINNIIAVAPQGRVYNIPEFDIIVTYTDTSLIPVTHKIRNCRFKNDMIDTQTGNTSIAVAVDIVCSHIDKGV